MNNDKDISTKAALTAAEESSHGNYGGTQAQYSIAMVQESINPNTGAFTLTIPLLKLAGINGLDLNLQAQLSRGKRGLLGLPPGWQFNLSFVIPGKSVTFNYQTYIIDANWSNTYGYRSGLKYLNNHGIKFQQIFPPQQLAYDQRQYYAFLLSYADGGNEYFDNLGRLIAQDDRYHNHILWYYQDNQGIFSERLAFVVDSYQQQISFSYAATTIMATLPNNTQVLIEYSQRGIERYYDALGYYSEIDYLLVLENYLPYKILAPSGLQTQVAYSTISYRDDKGALGRLPVVRQIKHLDLANKQLLDTTNYSYGSSSNGHNYSGYPSYSLNAAQDTLFESNNGAYFYDVTIQQLDEQSGTNQETQILYNFLHLPVRETLTITSNGGSQVTMSEMLYYADPNLHSRQPAYAYPLEINKFSCHADGSKTRLSQQRQTYDDHGRIVSSSLANFDSLKQQMLLVSEEAYQYFVAQPSYGLIKEVRKSDKLAHTVLHEIATLTADGKNIGQITTIFSGEERSDEIKINSYSYDDYGRVTVHELTPATLIEGCVNQVVTSYGYYYDASKAVLQKNDNQSTAAAK